MFLLSTVLLAIALAVGTVSIYHVFVRDRDPVAVRLRDLRSRALSSRPNLDPDSPSPLASLLATLGGFLPSSDSNEALKSGLVRAGLRNPNAGVVFLGTKIVGAAVCSFGWITANFMMARPIGSIVVSGSIAAAVGFYLPTVWLYMRGGRRQGNIQVALPDALDLLVVCVEAGLGLNAAIERVGREIAIASPELSDELLLVGQEIRTGLTRSDALRRLARRTGVDDLYALTAMLIQADKLGTSIAQSLRAHAESMRTKRRQRAEQAARKAGIKLAFPLVFLIFPALLIVILGPAAIQLAQAIASQNASR
jgi:tight adherence protein C